MLNRHKASEIFGFQRLTFLKRFWGKKHRRVFDGFSVLFVSVKPSPAKTNRQAPTSLPVCLIIIIVFFGKIHPFPKCSLAFSVALVQKQIAVWIIKLFRLLPLLEKCGFYNLKYPTVEIFARCGTICFYAVQDKISKEIFLVHRITVF